MKTCTFLLTASLWLLAPACSLYHDAREALPASADDRLALRLKEARDAESGAIKAVRAYGVSGTSLDADLDRVELAARDFNRSVLAADDVRTQASAQQISELKRLRERSASLSEIVAEFRANPEGPPPERLRRWLVEETQR